MGYPAWLDWATPQNFGRTGYDYKGGKPRVVLHTTETQGFPGYNGGAAQPHLTIYWRGKGKGFEVRQHQTLKVGARTLEGKSTNTWGIPCVNVEIVGYVDKRVADSVGGRWLPGLGDDFLLDLGKFLKRLCAEIDCPFAAWPDWWPSGSKSLQYGESAPQRMTRTQWYGWTGIVAHGHVPDNSHWDTGAIDVPRAVALAKGVTEDEKPSWETAKHIRQVQVWLNAVMDAGLEEDGARGPKTEAATLQFQTRHDWHNLKPDGSPGPNVYAALEADMATLKELEQQVGRIAEMVGELHEAWLGWYDHPQVDDKRLRRIDWIQGIGLRSQYSRQAEEEMKAQIAGVQAALSEVAGSISRGESITPEQVEKAAARGFQRVIESAETQAKITINTNMETIDEEGNPA